MTTYNRMRIIDTETKSGRIIKCVELAEKQGKLENGGLGSIRTFPDAPTFENYQRVLVRTKNQTNTMKLSVLSLHILNYRLS